MQTTRPVLFFFNDTATTEIYTLSLHDALPILKLYGPAPVRDQAARHLNRDDGALLRLDRKEAGVRPLAGDRKSTRLNSSHQIISYAVFCLKKKNKINNDIVGSIFIKTS